MRARCIWRQLNLNKNMYRRLTLYISKSPKLKVIDHHQRLHRRTVLELLLTMDLYLSIYQSWGNLKASLYCCGELRLTNLQRLYMCRIGIDQSVPTSKASVLLRLDKIKYGRRIIVIGPLISTFTDLQTQQALIWCGRYVEQCIVSVES